MLFLVDGYNAVRRVERLRTVEARDGLAAGRDALVSAIVSSGILAAHRVVVIFDGDAAVHAGARTPHPSIHVRYSRAPETADDAIVSFLETKRRGKATTVVTADEELAFSARRLGAAVAPPDGWEGLRVPRKKKGTPVPSSSPDKPAATKADVAYWLEIFEEDS